MQYDLVWNEIRRQWAAEIVAAQRNPSLKQGNLFAKHRIAFHLKRKKGDLCRRHPELADKIMGLNETVHA